MTDLHAALKRIEALGGPKVPGDIMTCDLLCRDRTRVHVETPDDIYQRLLVAHALVEVKHWLFTSHNINFKVSIVTHPEDKEEGWMGWLEVGGDEHYPQGGDITIEGATADVINAAADILEGRE